MEFEVTFFLNFSFWILTEEAFSLWGLPRRAGWQPRLLVGLVCYAALGYAVVALVNALGAGGTRFYFLIFLAFFALTVLMWRFVLGARWGQILFCCASAYALQHVTYSLVQLAGTLLEAAGASWVTGLVTWRALMNYGSYVLTGFLGWRLLMRDYRGSWRLQRGDAWATALSLVILLVSLGLSSLTDTVTETSAEVVCRAYAIVSCLLALSVQFGLFANDRSQGELEGLEAQIRLGERRRRLAQGTIDAINRRYHDLKHLLATLWSQKEVSSANQALLAELEEQLCVYDTLYETGNQTLDLVLTEKGLACDSEHIALSVMADGSVLGFLSAADLYTLLSAALDTAIELQAVVEPKRRSISLKVSRRAQVVAVALVCSCEVGLTFEDGLLVGDRTGDPSAMLLGSRSIRYVCERYGGQTRMEQEGTTLRLTALFSRPDQTPPSR